MSNLIDLDFETTAECPSTNVIPLGTEALISYNSPTGEKRASKNNQSKENVNKNNNSNTGEKGSLFDDLGIQDHTKQQQTDENSKPLSESDIIKKFSSPTHK